MATTPTSTTTTSSDKADIQISDVNKSLWKYIRTKKLWEVLIFGLVTIVWEAVIIYFLVKYTTEQTGRQYSGNNSQGFAYFLIGPIILAALWLYRLRMQFETDFLEGFAKANNYTFDKQGTVDETYGSIFRTKGRITVSDVMTGTYKDSGLRMFLTEVVIGSGRYQQQYNETVLELDVKGQLPNLLMSNQKGHFGKLNLTHAFGIDNTIKLEGDFNNFFMLQAQKGNETEALEVFTPDVMALMEDESKHYSVEFAGDRMYIYGDGFVGTSENLTQLFTLAKALCDKLAPLAARLKHDSAITAAPVNIIKPRRQHTVTRIVSIVVFVIAFLLILGGTIFGVIHDKPQPTAVVQATQPQPKPSAGTTQQATDPTGYPDCGILPSSSLPAASESYLLATIQLNEARMPISNALHGGVAANSKLIGDQINADDIFLKSVEAINYPQAAQADATQAQNSIKAYDSLLAQELTGETVSAQSLSDARIQRSVDSSDLRQDLGLPQSTCSFNEP